MVRFDVAALKFRDMHVLLGHVPCEADEVGLDEVSAHGR